MQPGKRAKGIAVGAAIAMALYASGFFVVLTPLPILYVSVTRSYRDGILAALIATGIVATVYAAAIFGFPRSAAGAAFPVSAVELTAFFSRSFLVASGVGYFSFFAAVAVVLGEGLRRRWEMTRCGGTAMAAGLAVFFVIVIVGMGSGADGGMKIYLAQVVREVAKMSAGANSGVDVSLLERQPEEIVSFLMGVLPSAVFVFTLLTVVVNMLVGRRMIHRGHAFAHIRNVARFRLPDAAIWAVIAGGVLFFFNSYLLHIGWLRVVAINVLIASGALYFFQGLAVVAYLLQGVRAPFIRTMAYVAIILFFQTLGVLIVAIGIADVWADFRLRHWRARHSQHP